MRKYLSYLFVIVFTLSLAMPQKAQAEMPAKAKAFLTIVGYGAAGGAILGAATMAFGNSSRAIAQGASLGLYAGIIFGSYVLISHHQRRYGTYERDSAPYQDSSDIYGDDYQSDEGGSGRGSSRGGFFDRFQVMQEQFHNQSFTFDSAKKKGGQMPPLQVNLLQYNF